MGYTSVAYQRVLALKEAVMDLPENEATRQMVREQAQSLKDALLARGLITHDR